MRHSHFHRPPGRLGAGTRITSDALGEALSTTPASRFKHPWCTTAKWSPTAKRWVATVIPGFVNERTPIFRATVEEQKESGNPWENNPLTGRPFFSDSVFSSPTAERTTRTVDLPLHLNPAIPLDIHGIGFDGDPSLPVPQFFLDLGVAKAPRQPSPEDLLEGLAEPVDPTPPTDLRLLRACDLWLHQPRLALTSDVSLQPGPATGISNVTQTLGVRSPAASDVLRIFQGTFTPFIPFSAGIDPLAGDYEEPTYDELLISTVYLLSPPNTPLGSMPDPTWQPYVRHNLFWNLQWAQPVFRQVTEDPGTPFIPPLAGGAAQLVINFLTASLNDTTQQALNILSAHSLAGNFWTPTGGGRDATFAAPAAAQKVKTGPDLKANQAAKIAASQAAKRIAQLDPDFPYTAQPFPISFITAA
ncbi:MAG: hypothetical protein ACAI37_15370 [Chthoniobacter sp.]